MSGLDGLVAKRGYTTFGLGHRKGPGEYTETTWDKFSYYLGKPEEWTASLIGNLVSDDPKYDWDNKARNVYEQASFSKLGMDIGLDPYTATIAGISAAIINPLDPLNKVKVLGLTKAGKVAEAADVARKLGRLEKVGDAYQISKLPVETRIKEIESALAGTALSDAQKATYRSELKTLQASQQYTDQVNAALKKYQTKKDINQIALAPTMWEQARLGQRKAIGFSSPFVFDQLPFTSRKTHENLLYDTTILGAPSAVDAAIIGGVGSAAKAVKKLGADVISGIIERVSDYRVAMTPQMKDVSNKITAIVRQTQATARERLDQIRNLAAEAKKSGMSKQDFNEVLDAIESPVENVVADVATRQVIQEAIDSVYPDPFDYAFGVPREGESTIPGSRLGSKQELLISPSTLSANERVEALDNYVKSKYRKLTVTGNEQYLDDKYVVLNVGNPRVKDEFKPDDYKNLYGIAQFDRVDAGDNTYLVARRLPRGKRPVPFQAGDNNVFTPVHQHNLEIVASQLVAQKKALTRLRPTDILVNDLGGVQIINPSIIQDAKSADAALQVSQFSVRQFLNELKAVDQPFEHLSSTASAKKAARNAKSYMRASKADLPDPSSGAMVTADVLNMAENMEGFRQMLRGDIALTPTGQLYANDVRYWLTEIRKQRESGNQVIQLPAVEMGRHPDGWFYIKEGRARLAAAYIEGLPYVPVKKVTYTGDKVDFSTYTGTVHNDLTNVFYENMDEIARNTVDEADAGFLAEYKLLSPDGKRRMVTSHSVASDFGERAFGRLTSLLGYSAVGFVPEKSQRAAMVLTQKYGNGQRAVNALTDRIMEAGSVNALADIMEAETGLGMVALKSTKIRRLVNEEIVKLKSEVAAHQEILAERGVFSPSGLQSGAWQKYDGVVEHLEQADPSVPGVLVFKSVRHDLETLRKYANESIDSAGKSLNSVNPWSRVRFIGSDGVQEMTFLDFTKSVGKEYLPAMDEVIPVNRKFSISDDYKKELEGKGIHFNPSKDTLNKAGLDAVVGRVLTKTGDRPSEFARPTWHYFVTEAGDLIVDTQSNSAAETMSRVFGEGPRFLSEYGAIQFEKVVVNNPQGSNIRKLGKAEVAVMSRRIKLLAQRFKDAGLSSNMKFEVVSPFDDSVWKEMFGTNQTIGSVIKPSWKLNLSDLHKDMPLDVVIESPHMTVSIQQKRFADGKKQQLFEKIQNIALDELREAKMAGLPLEDLGGYFGRFVTKEGQKAMAALNEEAKRELLSLIPTAKNRERFLKKRLWTDYNTREVNEIINTIRKEKLANTTPEELYKNIYTRLRDEGDFKKFDMIAEQLNKMGAGFDVSFFHDNVIFASGLRTLEQQTAVARVKIIQTLKESGAAVVTDAKSLTAIEGYRTKLADVEAEIGEVTTKIATGEAELLQLASDPSIAGATSRTAEAQDALDKLKVQRGKLLVRRDKLREELSTTHGPLADAVQFSRGSAYVDGSMVSKLVEQGLVTEDDVMQQLGRPLIKVPLSKYKSFVEDSGGELIFFTEEAKPIVDKFFGVADAGQNGWAKKVLALWDGFTDLWRRWTLYPIPSYHVRNAFSNTVMLMLGDVDDVESIFTPHKILSLLGKFREGKVNWKSITKTEGAVDWNDVKKAMTEMRVTDKFGNQVSGLELYDEFVRAGGPSGGLAFNEWNRYLQTVDQHDEFVADFVNAGYIPSSELTGSMLLDNKLLRGGRKAANFMDDRFRFAAFYDGWKKTGDWQQAALNMKKLFFDYNDLNIFERNVMRRIFPFYSWARFNIPRSLRMVAENPGRYYRMYQFVRELETGINDGQPVGENDLYKWLADRGGLVIGKDSNGNLSVVSSDGLIPTYDIIKMFRAPGDMFTGSLNPLLKMPVEYLQNRILNSDRELQSIPGQPANSFTLSSLGFTTTFSVSGNLGPLNLIANEHLMRSLLRPAAVLTKWFDWALKEENYRREKPGWMVMLLDGLIARAYSVDPMEANRQVYKDYEATRNKLESFIKYSSKNGYDAAARHARKLVLQLDANRPVK